MKDSKILLIKRGKNPEKGKWAFPGGHVDKSDRNIKIAALRELREETNITGAELEYIATIGNDTRDPRGHYTTNIFFTRIGDDQKVQAGDDAVDYCWFDIDSLENVNMAFDHKEILLSVLKRL